jgi:hypothetical protein
MMSGSMAPKGRNISPCERRNTAGSVSPVTSGRNDDDQADSEAVTCSVLCSLMSSTRPSIQNVTSSSNEVKVSTCENEYQSYDNECDYVSLSRSSDCKRRSNTESCTDHLQLPMFLSSKCIFGHVVFLVLMSNGYSRLMLETYHMIDRCDDDIATWSEKGDNFVVKNVEKFASVSCSCF